MNWSISAMAVAAFVPVFVLSACGDRPDSETITLDLGNVVPWVEPNFEVTDAVAHSGDSELLVTDPFGQRLHHINGVSGDVLQSWDVAGSPYRVVYNAGRNEAAIVHGDEQEDEAPSVLSLLSLDTGVVTEVEIGAPGIHATYSDDGLVYVLTRPSTRGFAVVVDPDVPEVLGTYELNNSGFVYEIGVTDDAVISGSRVYDRTPDGDSLTPRYRTEGTFAFHPHVTAISDDKTEFLYASRVTEAIDSHGVADGTSRISYDLGAGGGGPEDYGFSKSGDHMIALMADFDQQYLRLFDTETGQATGQINVLMPDAFETVIFDARFFVLSEDGQRAWVVLSRGGTSVLSWVDIVSAEAL